ncbi:MAG: nitrite reductase, copper-containing, partial [Candidatus Marinimicrobia bacterium]|nr:nitrite reductase, copper-containing [Candidatus Neomarinimicrobiota bacterium]
MNIIRLIKYIGVFTIFLNILTLSGCSDKNINSGTIDTSKIKVNGEMIAELTPPPFVPAPVGDRPAKKLLVEMEILEAE